MVVKKRGLGKGLAALIPDEPIDEESILNIDLSLIDPNKGQPRQEFEKESLEELTNSVKQYGIIQPIIVRKKENRYEIIAGERRWKAASAANLDEIPCIIKKVNDKEAMKLALIENIQRQDLNPIEEARAFRGLMDEHNLTQEEVAKAVGKSRSYIANTVRLLKLDHKTMDYISTGKISSGHGRALLGIQDEDQREEAVTSIVNNKTNVRETENMVKRKRKPKRIKPSRDPFVEEIEENLMRALGTKVRLCPKKDGGKIEIEFYGDEDLERLIDLLT